MNKIYKRKFQLNVKLKFTKMKTKILSFLVLICLVLIGTSAYAQPTTPSAANTKAVTAKDGDVVTYTVTGPAGGTYHWALSGGSSTNTVSTSSSNSVSITWNDATPETTYNLDVYVVSTDNCYSELYRFAITIESVALQIVDAATVTCSRITNGTGAAAATGNNPTVTANDIIEFVVNVDGTGAQNPITVNYSITATDVDTSGTDVNATGSDEITLSGTTGTLEVIIDDNFVNTKESGDVVYTITITSITDNEGNVLSIGTNKTATITVHPVPVITLP